MNDLAERIARKKVLIVGDLISDIDVHGTTTRFAQEAEGCPVIAETRREIRRGGAGAVALMVREFGAEDCLVHAGTAPSIKTRYFVGGRQVWRHDQDAVAPSAWRVSANVHDVEKGIAHADVVLIADYGKMGGAAAYPIWRAAIDGANARGIPVIVDPAHGTDWRTYKGATAIKCNAVEWRAITPASVGFWEEYTANLIVTRGSNGMLHCPRGFYETEYPARPSNCIDVTGAGDMVLAALGVCLAAGLDWPDACRFANIAAGHKVERHGAVAVPLADVLAEYVDAIKPVVKEAKQ